MLLHSQAKRIIINLISNLLHVRTTRVFYNVDFFTPKDQRFGIKITAGRGEVGSASLLSKLFILFSRISYTINSFFVYIMDYQIVV